MQRDGSFCAKHDTSAIKPKYLKRSLVTASLSARRVAAESIRRCTSPTTDNVVKRVRGDGSFSAQHHNPDIKKNMLYATTNIHRIDILANWGIGRVWVDV